MATTMKPARKRREIRAYRSFNRFLKATLGAFLTLRYNIQAENREIFDHLKPPYLIMPNHTNFWDPFMVSTFVPDPVCYVTADANFRYPILRFLLGLVGAIPKSKGVSDLETIKNIMRIRDRGGVVGIFPEGRRSYDGHVLKLMYATAKLVKLLKIPVVTSLLKGAFLSLPRWTKNGRKGRLTISFKLGLTSEEVARLSVDEIYERLTRLLDYDEYEFQKRQRIPYRGRNKAEYLECTLFLCPSCRSIGSLRSSGDLLSCTRCGHSVLYNELAFFEDRGVPQDAEAAGGAPRLHFETLRDWNLWQIEELRSMMQEARGQDPDRPIFSDSPVWLFRGYRSNPLVKFRFGTLTLFPDRLELYPLRGGRLVMPVAEMSGINVQNLERLEFYIQNTLYRFKFLNKRVSAYKWMLALCYLGGTGPIL